MSAQLIMAGTLEDIQRTNMALESLVEFPVPLTSLRVWNAVHTNLPGTAADDDLALITGTWNTNSICVRTGNAAATNTTQRAFFEKQLPLEYSPGQRVKVRVHAGMVTTVADNTATLDLEVYKSDEEAGVGSDLVTTNAVSINSLTAADKDFELSSAALNPGDVLNGRLTIAVVDAATNAAVLGQVGAIKVLCDSRG